MAPNFLCEPTNVYLEGKKTAQNKFSFSSCTHRKEARNYFISNCYKLFEVCYNLFHRFLYRKPECDIRIQLPNVSLEHAIVRVDNDRKVS